MPESPEASVGCADEPVGDRGLFASLRCLETRRFNLARGFPASLLAHALAAGALLFLPLLMTSQVPEAGDPVRVVVYNPPPPPLPPLPLGTRLPVTKERPQRPTVEPLTETRKLEAPSDLPRADPKPQAEPTAAAADPSGDPNGDPLGVPEGAKNGVAGGSLDGAPDGVLGGCPGCTGTDPVTDVEQGPRPIKITRPEYPQEAFIKKIEGTVELEIVIDARGMVVRARVTKSVPMLDQEAIRTVSEWRFAPALKHGRPVASLALAPVKFKLL